MTHLALKHQIDMAVRSHQAMLSPQVLRQIAMGAVAQWAVDQDRSVPAEKVLVHMLDAQTYIDTCLIPSLGGV